MELSATAADAEDTDQQLLQRYQQGDREAAEQLYRRYADQLRYLFIVSQVTLLQGSGNGTGGVHIEVKKADGAKCDRCWMFRADVGHDPAQPGLCSRCTGALAARA